MPRPGSLRTLQILIFASVLSGFVYGYNVGVYSGVIVQIQSAFALTDVELGSLIAIFDFAELVGVLIAPLANRIGRKRIMILSAGLLSVVPFLLLIELPLWCLMIERAITGCIAGITFTIGLVFVAEIAGPRQQATLLSSLMVGVSAGYLAELALSALYVEGEGWRLVILMAAGPALLQFTGLVFMAESPVFYLLRNDFVAAKRSARYYGLHMEQSTAHGSRSAMGIFEILRVVGKPGVGRSVLLGSIIVSAGTVSGASLVGSYGPLLMQRFSIADQSFALELLMLFTLLGFLIGLVALVPISRGYSPEILFGSLILVGASLLFLIFVSGYWAAACLGLLHLAFCFGIRTTVFQLLPSFLTDGTRAAGMAAFNLIYIVFAGAVNWIFPFFLQVLGKHSFLPFAVAAFLIAAASLWILRLRTKAGDQSGKTAAE